MFTLNRVVQVFLIQGHRELVPSWQLTSSLQFIHDEKSPYGKSFQNYFQEGKVHLSSWRHARSLFTPPLISHQMVIWGLDWERGTREKFPGSKLWQCFSVCCWVGNWWEPVCTSFVALDVSGKKLLHFSAKETQLSHIQRNLRLLGWLLSPYWLLS